MKRETQMSTPKKSLRIREEPFALHIITHTFLPPNLSFPKQFHSYIFSLSVLFYSCQPTNGIFHETRPGSVSGLHRVSSASFIGIYYQREFSRWVCVRDSFFSLPGDILLLLQQTDLRKIQMINILIKPQTLTCNKPV